MEAILVLEDGATFAGESFGARGEVAGEEIYAMRKGGVEMCSITLAPSVSDRPLLDLGDVLCRSASITSGDDS